MTQHLRIRPILVAATLLSMTGLAHQARAEDACSSETAAGASCVLDLEQARPGQSAVGMKEVRRKIRKIEEKDDDELQDYLDRHEIDVSIGPDESFHITDGHHTALALLRSGDTRVKVKIVANLSSLAWPDFWRTMKSRNLVYLNDESGRPISPDELPRSLDELKDDEYRSLAWKVRKKGGYSRTGAAFQDFLWADFFRARVSRAVVDYHFHEAAKYAEALSHTEDARGLPGWKPGSS